MSKTTKLSIALIAIAALLLSFTAGYRLRDVLPSNPGSASGLASIEQAWDIIYSDYVDPSRLDSAKLSQAAIKGMVTALDDPYTSYLTPQDYQLSLSSLRGEFDGIGAHVGFRDNKITIIAPLPDSPAAAAGILPGDIILEVNGQTTEGMSLEEAVLKIRGPSGTPVKLLVEHEGGARQLMEIVRAKVKMTSVFSEMRDGYAHISITQFTETTDAELTPVLEDITGKGAKGIILDLRRNPGGLLDTVIDVASHFVDKGIAVQVVTNKAEKITHDLRSGLFHTDLPIVVLVDKYSASGSEVLSGILKDYGRAVIAGATTFGKGSVNILRPLDDSGIYITTARWLTPNGTLIEGKGVEPDYPLEPDQDAVQWAIDYLNGKQP